MGRFLLPTCKRAVNAEGLGSSMIFWRAGAAYALMLNLTLADEPLVVGHGISTRAHTWLGLGMGACTGDALRAAMDSGALRRVDHHQPVDFSTAAGGGELREASAALAAGQRPPAGSFAAAVLRDHAANTVHVFHGCARLASPLADSLADRVEMALRQSYHRAAASRASQLPWAGAPLNEVQVALHYRAGDVLAVASKSRAVAGAEPPPEELPPRQRRALLGGGSQDLLFDTWHGHRLLPVEYAVGALRATLAALPPHVTAVCWLFSQGPRSWFSTLRATFPHLRLELAPLRDAPELALAHLDALAHADVLILGGGAFSELAASLSTGLKLAPPSVWRAQPASIKAGLNLSYPGGALTDEATRRISSLWPSALTAHSVEHDEI